MAGLPKRVTRKFLDRIEVAFRMVFAVSVISVALTVGGLFGFIAYVFQGAARALRRVLGIFR